MAKIWLILCFYVYVKLNSLILAVVNGDETLFLIRSYVTVGRNRKFHLCLPPRPHVPAGNEVGTLARAVQPLAPFKVRFFIFYITSVSLFPIGHSCKTFILRSLCREPAERVLKRHKA